MHDEASRHTNERPRVPSRQTLLLIVVLLSQVAAIVAAYGDHSYWTVIPAWWLSLITALLLVITPSDWRSARPRMPAPDAVIISLVTLLAGLLRFPNLERLPSGIHGDEGEFAAAGLAISQGHGPPLFGVAFLGDPAAYPHLLSLFIDAFGPDMAAVRLPSAIVGTLTVPALYLLVRSLANRRAATIAATLLATSAVHIHFSRLAINVIEVPFFACLCLLFLVRGINERRDIDHLLAGMMAGLAIYFHFGSRLIGLVLAITLVTQLLIDRRHSRDWLRAIALAGIGGLLALSPFLAHLSSQPDELTGHVAARGIWNHWDDLAARFGTEPSNKIGIVWEQLIHTFSAFVTDRDPTYGAQFYTFMDAPLLNWVLAPLAFVGLAVLCLQLRTLRARVLIIWFVVPLILASVLTDTAGQAHRLIHPLVPAIVACALLIDQIIVHLQPRLPTRVRPAIAAACVLIPLAAGAWDASRYFQPGLTESIAPAHTAQARSLEALPPGTIAIIDGQPLVDADHGPSRYLGHAITRQEFADERLNSLPDPIQTTVVILVHEWQREHLTVLRSRYPDLAEVEIERPSGTRVLTVVAPPVDDVGSMSILDECALNAASNTDDP
jgi:4-amino-4-deoxy-L-arabinose transferase-like glycosyltransferase